ncbi:hypothetical protein Glove_450g20 [Diversispora epigaea]|uniref:Uncharacterized protein n=1 Tax=Diversispora epigaea TaxID=1348612 RepID=A0A397GQ50_9GLOM|nr:hypothetical protein Glove_450g20 [Diversispora epigaea]
MDSKFYNVSSDSKFNAWETSKIKSLLDEDIHQTISGKEVVTYLYLIMQHLMENMQKMLNLKISGKGKFKNRIISDGIIQSMHLPDDRPKGIRLILEEYKLWFERGLNYIRSDHKKYSLKTIVVQSYFSL